MTVYGIRNLNSHIEGKKHKLKFSSGEWELVPEAGGSADEDLSLSLPDPVAVTSAPSLQPGRVRLCEAEDTDLGKFLHEYRSGRDGRAFIGLEYLVELQVGFPR